MKRNLGVLFAVVLGGCFATVDGQGHVVGGGEAEFTLDLPPVLPALVVVQPGVSVVGGYDREVFFADGYYWTRHQGGWARARDHRSGWSRVEPRYVPAPLVQAPPGRYRHYRGEGHQGQHGGHDERRER